jgi:hypothetical protein
MALKVLFQLLTVFADVTASHNKLQDICTSAVIQIFKLNCVAVTNDALQKHEDDKSIAHRENSKYNVK